MATESGCEELGWSEPQGRVHEGRVLLWTCDCQPVVYELVAVSGQRLIRRTRRQDNKIVTHESDRWRAKEADGIWNALLSGHVR
jgi:hypothetical protein